MMIPFIQRYRWTIIRLRSTLHILGLLMLGSIKHVPILPDAKLTLIALDEPISHKRS